MRVAIKIGYDGTKFYGFAHQPGRRTVEGDILRRLLKTKLIHGKGTSRFQYAARTDRGVSAFGNVIAFDCSGDALTVMQNLSDIWISGYTDVEPLFNPRHCKEKQYRYYLHNDMLDVKKMRMAAHQFIGKHDFSRFARLDGRNPFRTVRQVVIKRTSDIIKIDIVAESFLWNQVRRIIAALVKAGLGEINAVQISSALLGNIDLMTGTARAEGLVLVDVRYDSVLFNHILADEILIKKEMLMDALRTHRNK